MKTSKIAVVLVLGIIGLLPMEGVLRADDKPSREALNAVVRIDNVYSNPDFFVPWQNRLQEQSIGSGVVISGQRILTNAHNVTNSTFVTVRRQNDDTLYTAKIVAVDHDCDLAILTVEDAKFFANIVPFELGATPPTQSRIVVAGFPVGGDGISLTQGIISRIETREYVHSGMTLLAAQIDAATNPGNSGGPALFNGKVVGIAFQGDKAGEALGYIIPNEIIQHFLTDLKDGRVDGFGRLGCMVAGLDNPDMRRFLKMKPEQTGVLVYSVPSGGAKSPFKKNDVLLAVAGKTIANNGNIRLPDGEPRLFMTLIDERQVGEKIDVSILRDGNVQSLSLTVSKVGEQVGPKIYDKAPDYYFVGGLAFTTLSCSYLAEWGKQPPPAELAIKVGKWKEKPEEETIILSQVLADKVNMGYQTMAITTLKSVNGEKVNNLRKLISIIENLKSEFVIFEFEDNPPIILDVKKMREATPRIMERYRVPADRSKNLM